MSWPLAYIVVISVCLIDALVTLAALHPRFNPRLSRQQREQSFGRVRARGVFHSGSIRTAQDRNHA